MTRTFCYRCTKWLQPMKPKKVNFPFLLLKNLPENQNFVVCLNKVISQL